MAGVRGLLLMMMALAGREGARRRKRLLADTPSSGCRSIGRGEGAGGAGGRQAGKSSRLSLRAALMVAEP